MSELLDDLRCQLDHKNDLMYFDNDIRAKATEVYEYNEGNALLAMHRDTDYPSKVSFIVFEFLSSNNDGTDKRWNRVFHGYGFEGGLRELRHSYWGETDNQGYIFYPSERTICEAFALLRKWFDC